MKEHKTFKPFDKVLVRDSDALNTAWHCDFYSDYGYSIADEESRHYTASGGRYADNDILPYEGNEHLIGKTDEPDEVVELKRGEYVFVCDKITSLVEEWMLRIFDGCWSESIQVFNNAGASLSCWVYAIRFSDFNPNNMEKTLKHILCVKNGKVVKYKD